MTGNIVDTIEDTIDKFVALNDGQQPTKILLGRRTHKELKEFVVKFSYNEPLSGVPNYNGIPIVEIDEDYHVSVCGPDSGFQSG